MVESTFCTLLIEIDPVVNCTGFVVHIWGASFLCLCLSEVSGMCFSCGVQGGGAVGQCSHFLYVCRKTGWREELQRYKRGSRFSVSMYYLFSDTNGQLYKRSTNEVVG